MKKYKVILTKDFAQNLKIYCQNKKSLAQKVLDLKLYIENSWLDLNLFKKYDIKNLWNNYFRIKFIPYRIIVFIRDNNTFEFIEFFKRKWKSDYKDYN